MARLQPVDRRSLGFFSRLFVRVLQFFLKREFGKPLTPIEIAANNPRVLLARSLHETVLMGAHALDGRYKVLASLRVAMLVGCPF